MATPCRLQAFINLVRPFYKSGEYLDRYQNLVTYSFCHPGRLHKISLQSVRNILGNIGLQTDKYYRKHNLLCQGGIMKTKPMDIHQIIPLASNLCMR